MKPVEGTILTVSRGAAIGAVKKAESSNDAVEVMEAALEGAKAALAKTPDLLPVLKEVGVVDSGGQGLVFIYEGFLSALNGDYMASEDFKATPAMMGELLAMLRRKTSPSVTVQRSWWPSSKVQPMFKTLITKNSAII